MTPEIGSAFVTNFYDSLARLTATELWVSNTVTVNAHGYLYDNASQRTRHTRPDGAYFDLGYDGAGQLTRAWATNSAGSAITTQRYTYGYDAAFNMVKRTNNAAVETFTANNLNAERAKVSELAKAEFSKSGMAVKDYDVTAEEYPKAGKWTVWFEQKGEFPVPGGRHLVEIEVDTGKAVFMKGE